MFRRILSWILFNDPSCLEFLSTWICGGKIWTGEPIKDEANYFPSTSQLVKMYGKFCVRKDPP